MTYTHTQRSPLHYLLIAVAAGLVAGAVAFSGQPVVGTIFAVTAALSALFALCFASLTVSTDQNRLHIKFGPLPLFQRSIPYEDITQAEAGRSSIIDGWGVHYVPVRGWTYNLWGFGCVVLHTENSTIRIGTDDAENLLAALEMRMQTSG